jgi:hypothetical protein
MTGRCSRVYVLAVGDMHAGERGAEMTFSKPAGPADLGQRAGALWTADSGRAVAETELGGLWYVVGRRS